MVSTIPPTSPDLNHRHNYHNMDASYPVITLEMLSGKLDANVNRIDLELIGDKEDRTKVGYAVATAEKIAEHATNYRENFFDGSKVREDILRYLHFYAIGEEEEPKYGEQDELSALLDASLWSERQDDEAKVAQLIKYSSINEETAYVIGFTIILSQIMAHVREYKKNVRLCFEDPFGQVLRKRRFAELISLLTKDHSGIIETVKSRT